MKKTIISLVLILALLSIGGQAFAATSETIPQAIAVDEPGTRLTLITYVFPSLSVSGTTATYSLTIACPSSVTSIKAELQLQKYINSEWTNYSSSWTVSSSTNYLFTDGTKAVESDGTYRLKVTVTATDGTTTGKATTYSA